MQVVSAYLADLPEVVEAKAAHKKVFDAYTAGEIPLPVAPVHEVKPVRKLFLLCTLSMLPKSRTTRILHLGTQIT